MGTLRVLSPAGDKPVLWDQEQAEVGDPEALKAVREAERIFEKQRSRGATAYRVEQGVPAKRLYRFDPEADQIVVVPRVMGG